MNPKCKLRICRLFRPRRLILLILGLIAFIIWLAMRFGGADLAEASEWAILGLGLGAMLAWAVGIDEDDGSGSPSWRRVRFFNSSDKKSLGVKFRKVDVPNSPTNEGAEGPDEDLGDVDPGQPKIDDRGADAPLDEGVQGIRIDFQIQGGPLANVTAELTVPMPTVPPDPMSSSFVEESWAFLRNGPNPNEYELVVFLMHSTQTDLPLTSQMFHFPVGP